MLVSLSVLGPPSLPLTLQFGSPLAILAPSSLAPPLVLLFVAILAPSSLAPALVFLFALAPLLGRPGLVTCSPFTLILAPLAPPFLFPFAAHLFVIPFALVLALFVLAPPAMALVLPALAPPFVFLSALVLALFALFARFWPCSCWLPRSQWFRSRCPCSRSLWFRACSCWLPRSRPGRLRSPCLWPCPCCLPGQFVFPLSSRWLARRAPYSPPRSRPGVVAVSPARYEVRDSRRPPGPRLPRVRPRAIRVLPPPRGLRRRAADLLLALQQGAVSSSLPLPLRCCCGSSG